MSWRPLLLIGLAAVIASSCSGGSKDSNTPFVPPTPSATPSKSPKPSPTARRTPSPTPTPSPSLERPVTKPARDGDVDGDGRADRVAVSAGSGASLWNVTVRLTALGQRVGQVHDADGQPRLAGVVDADADGFAEVFLQTGAGASTDFFTPVRLVDGVLREVTIGGQPAQLAAGGSVTHGNGFACRNTDRSDKRRELVVYDGQTLDGVTWEGEITTYRWAGGVLKRLSSRHESFRYTGVDDQKVARYYQVDCGSLDG